MLIVTTPTFLAAQMFFAIVVHTIPTFSITRFLITINTTIATIGLLVL
jgi:hypothetical protein